MIFGILVCGVLAVWFVLSVLNQFTNIELWPVRRWDYFSLLPKWTFFAPNPGTNDYDVLYRDGYADGTVSEWTEARLSRAKNFITPFWHPDKRLRKVVTDTMRSVGRIPRDGRNRRNRLCLSVPYLSILHFVSHLPASPVAVRRQFIVMQTSGYFPPRPPKVILRSEFHKL